MTEYIITEEKIKKLLWWTENLGLKPVEDCLNEILTSTPIIERNTCGCLCDCCMATKCVRNSGRGYPVKEMIDTSRAPGCEFASDEIACKHPHAKYRHCSMNRAGNGHGCPKKNGVERATKHPRKDCYNCGTLSCGYTMIDGTGVTTKDAVEHREKIHNGTKCEKWSEL